MSEPTLPPTTHDPAPSTPAVLGTPPMVVEPSWLLLPHLSAMMFLQFIPPGLWAVTLSSYIGANTGTKGSGMFDSSFVGTAGMAAAVGALVSPLLFGALADGWFRSERMVAILNVGCACMLYAMRQSTEQWWFFAALLGYYQCSVPAVTLVHSMALRHLAHSKNSFPVVRAMGTAGWILSLWVVGSFIPDWRGVPSTAVDSTTDPMLYGVIGHLVMALFALTLPKTLPLGKGLSLTQMFAGWRSLLTGQPRLLRFLLVTFCATMSAQFYNLYILLYLNNIGVNKGATRLTFGLIVEIFAMLALPWLLVRWGPKRVIVIGVIAWIVRYVCMAFGGPEGWPLVAVHFSLLLHGVCFVFVYITAYIYVDHSSTPATQSAAQGLLALVTSGLAHLSGALLTGRMQAWFLTPAGVSEPTYDWQSFYLVAAGVSTLALILFGLLMGFHREVMPGEISPDEGA